MIRTLLLSTLLVALLPGCSSVTEYDSGVNFSALQSFAWKTPPTPTTESPALNSELFGAIVHGAVVSTLKARNYQLTNPQTADFLVTYHVEHEQEEFDNSVEPRFGLGMNSSGPIPRMTNVRNGGVANQDMGVLSIAIINAHNGKEIWRGWRSKSLNRENFSKEGIARTVTEILADFPPEH